MGERFQFQYPFPPEVHEADRQMLALEMKYIRGQDPADHAHLNGVNIDGLENLVDLTSWSPEEAYRRFKKAWIILRPSELSA